MRRQKTEDRRQKTEDRTPELRTRNCEPRTANAKPQPSRSLWANVDQSPRASAPPAPRNGVDFGEPAARDRSPIRSLWTNVEQIAGFSLARRRLFKDLLTRYVRAAS
jgi:hypothetical protein